MSNLFSDDTRAFYDEMVGRPGAFNEVVEEFEVATLAASLDPGVMEAAEAATDRADDAVTELLLLDLRCVEAQKKGDLNFVAFANTMIVSRIKLMEQAEAHQALAAAIAQLSRAVRVLDKVLPDGPEGLDDLGF